METVDRGEPVRRRLVVMRIVAVIAVTDDRGAGVALVRDAVVYAGEHRRYREIGIGVGTARAMLDVAARRSEEHTSELQSLMRSSYAVFFLNKQTKSHNHTISNNNKPND